jgi:hypothetical protein
MPYQKKRHPRKRTTLAALGRQAGIALNLTVDEKR